MRPHPIRSRIAPTPSGYIHLGNAVNFLITWALVRSQGGELLLRIDDMDPARTRPEYVEEIFRSLEWLGIGWDHGPSGVEDFYRNFSIQTRKEYYRNELKTFQKTTDRLYACTCSRKEILSLNTHGIYPGTCRTLNHTLAPEHSALRVMVPELTNIVVDKTVVSLDKTLGDFVLWRRDDTPSYQFASLIDDRDGQIDTVVRGDDLRNSTAAQLYLAWLFDIPSFLNARFIHHPLMMYNGQRKLSKSEGDQSIKTLRESGANKALVFNHAVTFLKAWQGIPEVPALLELLDNRR